MNDILKEKDITLKNILDINERLYDREVMQLVQWLLAEENIQVNENDIYEQIRMIRT